MRITRQMIVQDALRGMRTNLEHLHRANQEVITGHRIGTVSDGPTDAAALMRLESQLRGIDRYQRAISLADTRLSAEEAALESVATLLDQASAAALAVDTSTGGSTRQTAANEVRAIRDQIISLGNTEVMDEYIFAGTAGGSPPFLPDGTYTGNGALHEVEIGDQVRVAVGHPGDQVLSRAIAALDNLANAVESGTRTSVQSSLAELNTGRDDVRATRSTIASLMRELTDQEQHLMRLATRLEDHEQEIDEVDPAEAVVRLTQARDTLERSYAAIAKVLSMSITDYLR